MPRFFANFAEITIPTTTSTTAATITHSPLLIPAALHPATASIATHAATATPAARNRERGTTTCSATLIRRNDAARENRSRDAGQIPRGGYTPKNAAYDSMVFAYQSWNFSPSARPPLVGPWCRGRPSVPAHKSSQYDRV